MCGGGYCSPERRQIRCHGHRRLAGRYADGQRLRFVVLDIEIETPFHHLAREVMVGTGQELRDAVRYFEDVGMTYYKPLLDVHLPLAPESAHALTCELIEAIAASGLRDVQQGLQIFDLALFQSCLGEGRQALEPLQYVDAHVVNMPLEPFARLIGRRASRRDLAQLQEDMGYGFHLHLLKSLWVRQLVTRGNGPAYGTCAGWTDSRRRIIPCGI